MSRVLQLEPTPLAEMRQLAQAALQVAVMSSEWGQA
jgi:hypothetical protein